MQDTLTAGFKESEDIEYTTAWAADKLKGAHPNSAVSISVTASCDGDSVGSGWSMHIHHVAYLHFETLQDLRAFVLRRHLIFRKYTPVRLGNPLAVRGISNFTI